MCVCVHAHVEMTVVGVVSARAVHCGRVVWVPQVLNQQNYILKKGRGIYQLQTSVYSQPRNSNH